MGKLRASAAEDASIVPEQIAPKPSRLTSADILGLNRQQAAGKQRIMSVEMELDKYLSDSNSGTGILEYWQVNLIILTPSNLNFFTNMLYNFREHQHSFPTVFIAFFVWQWISYQFRHQASPVNTSFHLESRQWRLGDHAFQLN